MGLADLLFRRAVHPRFAAFGRRFASDRRWPAAAGSPGDVALAALRGDAALIAFLGTWPGVSFNRGVYRSLAAGEIAAYIARVAAAWPAYAERICPFGYDWLNRIYCVDFGAVADGAPALVMFSHLNGLVVDIPMRLEDFHNTALVAHYDEALEVPLFGRFLAASGKRCLERQACAGMGVPLFLGGEYGVDNMQLTDVEVDWHITTQLLCQTRELEPGAVVSRVSVATG